MKELLKLARYVIVLSVGIIIGYSYYAIELNIEQKKLDTIIGLLNQETPTGVIITTDHERDLRFILNPLISDLTHYHEKKDAMMRLENAGILKNGEFNLTEPDIDFEKMMSNCNILKIEKETGVPMPWIDKIFMWFDNFDPKFCDEINLLP
mgnify:CR=1 FL=1